MEDEIIRLTGETLGPYSPAVKVGDYIFVSGQIGFKDSKTGKSIQGIENQTKQCLENMKRVLARLGSSLDNVVKVTVFLKGAGDFVQMNEIYKGYFPEYRPARSTVVTDLIDPNMLIEMDCIAYGK